MSLQPKPQEIKALNVEFNNDNKLWLTSGYTLRKLIGILGLALPLLLFLFLKIDSGVETPLESISHYYYTRAGSIFTIVVSLLAIFLIVYKGPKPIDFYLSGIAGIFALCLLIFPTDNITDSCCENDLRHAVTFLPVSEFRKNFHYISAGIFLLSLASMSLFLFTRSPIPVEQRGENKKKRNVIFIICGIVMVAALLVIFIGGFLGAIPEDVYNNNHLTFWMEALAVEAFGLSWLVKGEMILKNNRYSEQKN